MEPAYFSIFTPCLGAERVPGLRVACDEGDGLERLDQECIAQTGRLRCVPGDGFVQFVLGGRQQLDVHAPEDLIVYLPRTSASGRALISPRR